jgi:hypothetical protein
MLVGGRSTHGMVEPYTEKLTARRGAMARYYSNR